jgi:UDP-N-acetylmuramyl pentapeptide phosphotransferase/UDP-N-acetylglucosamine-1-phosphate transferase
MGLLLTTIAAGAVWIVLLSLGIKPFDALMVSALMIFLAATAKLVAPFLPWNSRDERPGDRYMPR